jgi:hypothetical protein
MAGPPKPPKTSAHEVGKGGADRIAGRRSRKHAAALERAKNPGEPNEPPHAPDATFAEVIAAKDASTSEEEITAPCEGCPADD